MQKIWTLLLDDEFLEAYHHGILVECADGIIRRLFPRFLTYSADYPEKCAVSASIGILLLITPHRVLLTAIKNLGKCPCPRCLTPMNMITQSGTKRDLARRLALKRVDDEPLQLTVNRARDWLFTRGYKLSSAAIKGLLDSRSLVPIQVQFTTPSQLYLLLINFGTVLERVLCPDLTNRSGVQLL